MKLEKISQAEAVIRELKAIESFLAPTKFPTVVPSSVYFNCGYKPPTYNPKAIGLGHMDGGFNASFYDEQLKAEIVQSVKAYKCRLEKELLEL